MARYGGLPGRQASGLRLSLALAAAAVYALDILSATPLEVVYSPTFSALAVRALRYSASDGHSGRLHRRS